MLNRTNRTLSATKTGLNLGTRSFATLANANLDAKTLRFPARLAAVRVGAWESGDDIGPDAIAMRSYPLPAMPSLEVPPAGSSPRLQPATSRGRGAEPQGQTPELVILRQPRALRAVGSAPSPSGRLVRLAKHQRVLSVPRVERSRVADVRSLQSPCRCLVPDIRP